MPQLLRVLQCIECLMHQVDIVKKAKKWQCKVCGAKQNLRKECYRGSGAECRATVQELNMEEHEKILKGNHEMLNLLTNDDDFDWAAIEKKEHEMLMHQATITTTVTSTTQGTKESKWSAYVEGDRKYDETQGDIDARAMKPVATKDVGWEAGGVIGQDVINRDSSSRQESKRADFGREYESKVENDLESLDALYTNFDWEVVEEFEQQALACETEVTTSSRTESILAETVAEHKRNDEFKESNCAIDQQAMKHKYGIDFSSGVENKLPAPMANFKQSMLNASNNEHQANTLNFGNKRKWSRPRSTTSRVNVERKINEASNGIKSRKQSKWDQFMY